MNSFKISYLKDGSFIEFDGTSVFPFSYANLLDERLDEAYLTIYNDSVEYYKPTTVVEVELHNSTDNVDKTRTKYYIVAQDTPLEMPVGSGKYKHTLYIIELTKLLEGILCQSLTFTNCLGKDYSKGITTKNIIPTSDLGITTEYLKLMPTIHSPYNENNIIVPSVREIMNPFFSHPNINGVLVATGDDYKSRITVKNGDGEEISLVCETEEDLDKTITIQHPVDFISITYTAVMQAFEGSSQFTQFGCTYTPIRFRPNQLPLKRLTVTDCVNRVLLLAETLKDGESPRFTFNEEQAQYYDKVLAPEFTMTQCTLREQLKVIGGYIHAEPRLTYVKEANCYEIVFDRYRNNTPARIQSLNLPYVYKGYSYDINNYSTEIRSNAQNLVNSMEYARGVVVDPGNNIYRSIRSEILYMRVNADNGIVETQFPIYSIQKIECGLRIMTGLYGGMTDITPYIFESVEYNTNLSGYSGYYPYSKEYAIYYTRGSKNIGGLFYQAPNVINTAALSKYSIVNILSEKRDLSTQEKEDLDKAITTSPQNLVFRVTYKPIYSSFVSHGKSLYVTDETPYAQFYNQSENLIESDYYGEQLKGVAARLGNVEQERTYFTEDIDNIPAPGEMLDGFAISAVNANFLPLNIKFTVGLTKNFNRISQYIGINSMKRVYEISENQAYKRDILIKEVIVIGEKRALQTNVVFSDLQGIRDVFSQQLVEKNTVNTVEVVGMNSENIPLSKTMLLPVVASSFGNSIVFSFAFDDNYSAGNKLTFVKSTVADVSGYWQDGAKYTDYYGKISNVQFALFRRMNSFSGNDAFELPEYSEGGKLSDGSEFKSPVYQILKDSREALSFNIELEFKTDRDDLIIGSALASRNSWVYSSPHSAPVLYLIKDIAGQIGKFDKDIINLQAYLTYSTDITSEGSDNLCRPSFDGKISVPDNYGWVIAYPVTEETTNVEDSTGNTTTQTIYRGGEILLASNTPIAAGEYLATELFNNCYFNHI